MAAHIVAEAAVAAASAAVEAGWDESYSGVNSVFDIVAVETFDAVAVALAFPHASDAAVAVGDNHVVAAAAGDGHIEDAAVAAAVEDAPVG